MPPLDALLRNHFFPQFKRPQGALGHLAGAIMARNPSNRARNEWTARLLECRPDDTVLEIGSGPGLALEACLKAVPDGRVVGIDHSAAMIAQAGWRLRPALRDGRLELRVGGLELLGGWERTFDRVFSVNVVHFLHDLDGAFAKIFAAVKPGGRAATTYMPRNRNPTRDDALRMAERVARVKETIGFTDIRMEELPLDPAPALCVIGERGLQDRGTVAVREQAEP